VALMDLARTSAPGRYESEVIRVTKAQRPLSVPGPPEPCEEGSVICISIYWVHINILDGVV
jgi:hypothetical protein